MSSTEDNTDGVPQPLLRLESLSTKPPVEDISAEGLAALEVLTNEVRRIALRIKRDGNTHDVAHRAVALMQLFNVEPTVPIGWSKNSGTPYYKEKYGQRVKAILDVMATDETKDRVIDPVRMKMTRESLKALITQGWLWLIDKHGKESTYAEMRERIRIRMISDGVKLEWMHQNPIGGESYIGEAQDKHVASLKWKVDLIEWIETGIDGSQFEKTGLNLTTEQMEYIRTLIDEVKDSACIVTHVLKSNRICFIKDKQLYEDVKSGKV